MNLSVVSLRLIRSLEVVGCFWCFVLREDRSAIATANVNLADVGDKGEGSTLSA